MRHVYNSVGIHFHTHFEPKIQTIAIKAFLALLQESSYFYFSQLEAGQKRKG